MEDHLVLEGGGRGIAWRKGFAWNRRLAFIPKDISDQKFMRRSQVSG